jgi:hypothetical protein
MNEDYRKKYAVKLLYSITPDNVEQIYNRNFTRYLFENSDEVTINGKVYGNSFEDKITKACFMFPNEQGESNIKTASGCNTKGGFPLTELDFINNQLDNLKDLSFSDLVQRKKYETYLNFIENKKTQLQIEPNFTNKPQQQIQENRIESQIEPFNPEIFLDQYSYDLFLFLVDEYATSKRPKQFSQLFHWMQRQNFIKPTTGKKYQKFVRERFPEMVAKFSRIDVRNRDEMTTLNELGKKFNSLNKV